MGHKFTNIHTVSTSFLNNLAMKVLYSLCISKQFKNRAGGSLNIYYSS